MSLIGLSSDALQLIVVYIDAIEIFRLFQCGSALLSSKLKQVDLNLVVPTRPFMQFPFSLFSLPHLVSLSLKSYLSVSSYPLRFDRAVPLPSTPVNSLRKLALACHQSFSILVQENGLPLLEKVLPNLKILRLTESTVPLNVMHMRALPWSLEKVKLQSNLTTQKYPNAPFTLLHDLPPELRKLEVISLPIALHPEHQDYSGIVWPVELRCLRLGPMSPCILDHLPPYLEELSFHVWEMPGIRLGTQGGFPNRYPTDRLPVTMKYLSVSDSSGPSYFKFVPTTWPPALKRFLVPMDFGRTTKEAWACAPKSLTSINLEPEILYTIKLSQSLPNLRAFTPAWGFQAFPDLVLSNLPPFLTEFENEANFIEQIANIPETLRKMKIKIRPSSLSLQPSYLNPDAVSITPLICDMARLPRGLEDLSFLSAHDNAKFYRSDFENLPGSLKTLKFNLFEISNLEVLSALPNSLKTIIIDIRSRGRLLLDSLMDNHVDALEQLPSSLTDLTIIADEPCTSWDQWMCSTSRFTSLRMLAMLANLNRPMKEIPPLDSVSLLPRMLTSLDLTLFGVTICPKHIRALPKSLTKLRFFGQPSIGNTASDDCFLHLPPPLVELRLPGALQGLTIDVFHILPISIVSLQVPDNIRANIKIFHERQSHSMAPSR
jgi:hypothetical protein